MMGHSPSKESQIPPERDQQSAGLTQTHTSARDQSAGETSVSRGLDASSDLSELVSDLTQDQFRCGVCEQVLKDPVIASCGHNICQECVASRHPDPDQPGPCEDQTCPLCSQEMRETAKQSVVQAYKDRLQKRFKYVSDGGVQTLLCSIYTELRNTEVEREGMNMEHEVWRLESALRSQTATGENKPISCNDIFRPLPGRGAYVKTVMTKGVAGIGKTVSAQKFVLDWADGDANQDIDFVFMLPFRSLNLIEHSWYSLQSLLLELHPELKELKDPQLYEEGKVVLIFDGLDESRLGLNFEHNYVLCDTNNFSSVDVLVANLIQGNLLPSAHVWITSRPAASKQIPLKYVDRVTEIQGFGDPQKEEYLRKRIGDEHTAREIASHIKACKILRIMCQVPAICGVAATVFPHILDQDNSTKHLPETLKEMYIHLLLRQEQTEMEMFEGEDGVDGEASRGLKREVIVKLSELAFAQLQKGGRRFGEDDLRECGIGMGDAAVYSVVFREIFQEEPCFAQTRVFRFVHLSVQEFLAALFIIRCCARKNVEPLENFLRDTSRDCGEHSGKNRKGVLSSIKHIFEIQPAEGHSLSHPPEEGAASLALLKSIVSRVVEISEGHLDHFLLFLVGLSQASSQELLLGLLPDTFPDSSKVVDHVRALLETDVAPERCISLLRCLAEVKDDSIHRDLQKYLHSRRPEEALLSPALCSALAHRLLVSEEVLEELDLRSYNTSDRGRRRLMPALRSCRRAVLTGGEIDEKSFETVISALHSLSFPLRELDLSDSDLHNAWTIKLCTQLTSHHCRLDTLRLSSCALTDMDCVFLSSVLTSPSSLLRVLDLSGNPLQDKGAMLLAAKLESEHCKLHTLRVSSCGFTDAGCVHLASAVRSAHAALRELDLRGNDLTKSTAHTLLGALQEPQCRLHTLRLDHAAVLWTCLGPVQYSRKLTLDPNTAHTHLLVSGNGRRATHTAERQPHPSHPERFQHRPQLLCTQPLSARCYWDACWSQDGVSVGVAYGSIGRKGWGRDQLLGYNVQSWCLFYSHGRCSAWHDKNQTLVPQSPGRIRSEPDLAQARPRRVGVYLDWEAGALSFYSVSSDTLSRLHVFSATFTEPLYAAFRLRDLDSSVSLCETV